MDLAYIEESRPCPSAWDRTVCRVDSPTQRGVMVGDEGLWVRGEISQQPHGLVLHGSKVCEIFSFESSEPAHLLVKAFQL